jgi:hypothetical protein
VQPIFADLFVSGKGIRGQYSTGPIEKKGSNCQKKKTRKKRERVEVSVPYSCCTSIKKIWWNT